MIDKEIHENWDTFLQLTKKVANNNDDQKLTKHYHYIEQNKQLMNDMLTLSIENLQTLQHLKNNNEIICLQTKFANDLNKKIAAIHQHFLHNSLEDEADYHAWLKSHCDLATD